MDKYHGENLRVRIQVNVTALQYLLTQDGIKIPESGKSERMIRCFAHDDDEPSMSINVAKNVFHCHSCGASGNPLTYLTKYKGMPKDQAIQKLKDLGFYDENIKHHVQQDQQKTEKRKRDRAGMPNHVSAPYTRRKNEKSVLAATYEYFNQEGRLACKIQRWEVLTENKVKKDFIPFTPRKEGGWWVALPANETLPKEDRAFPMPIYRLPHLMPEIERQRKSPDVAKRQIWMVEGEKCADGIANIKDVPGGKPAPLVFSLAGGSSQNPNKHDLSPIYGLHVLLISDADKTGRKFMRTVGKYLHEHNCECRYVLAKGETHYDILNAHEDGGWQSMMDWVKEQGGVLTHEKILQHTEEKLTTDPANKNDADDNSWPVLVPLDAPDLPRLDLAHLPTWAGDMARAVAADTETPLELAVGMILVACAVPAARRLRVLVKPGYFEPCNLWVMVALPPGNRKSAVQSAATAPLTSWQRDQVAYMEEDIKVKTSERKTMEARVKELRNKAAKNKDPNKAKELAQEAANIETDLPEIPAPPQLWTSDATPERLGAMLAEHGECMAWLSSEGGIFDLLQGRYSKGIPNLDLVLKAHSGDPERVDRGSRPPVDLLHPRLSIGLSPQPAVLKGLAAMPGFRGKGLLGRFLYLLPPSPLGYRSLSSNPVPERVRDAYERGLRAMLDWEPAFDEHDNEYPHQLHFTDEARSIHHAFALEIEVQMRPDGDFELCTDWAGKAPGAAARIAGVLHGIQHAHGRPWEIEITGETMNAAVEIINVIAPHSLAALEMMGCDTTISAARQLWEWIERGRRSCFAVREAFNALRAAFPRMKLMYEALEVLVERGYVEMIKPQREGPGRPPSPFVQVRPDILESW